MNETIAFKPTSEASAPVLTTAEAKLALRIDSSDEDAVIDRLIAAATKWCEDAARCVFLPRTIVWALAAWPADGVLEIPVGPVRSVTTVKYRATTDGTLTTIDGGDYQVDSIHNPGRILPAPGESWPDADSRYATPIEITYVAGLAPDAANLDVRAKQAVLLIAGHWYANREAVITGTITKEIELSATSLLRQLWDGRL